MKNYGEENDDQGQQQDDAPKSMLDFSGVMKEMSNGQRTFGHQLFDLKFDLERHYKIIEGKKIICVKSDQLLIKNKNNNERMQKYFGDLTIFMVRDVTTQRQIKKLSKQENNDIMFMANVAHDLRSPLNCMKGNNEII